MTRRRTGWRAAWTRCWAAFFRALQPLVPLRLGRLRHAASAASCAASRGALVVYARAAGRSPVLGFQMVPPGFVPTAGQAISGQLRAAAEGATLDRTESVIRKMSDIALKEPGVRERGRVPRPVDQRLHQQPVGRHRVRDPEAVRRAQLVRPVRHGDRPEAAGQIRRHPGRDHRDLPAAAGAGPGHHRRLQAAGRGSHRPGL